MFSALYLTGLYRPLLIWGTSALSHQVSANLLISIIERIPFCTFGSVIILVPRIESHYEDYLQGSFGFMFQFILSLCSLSSNRQRQQLLNLSPGINKVNRISSYLILSRIHKTPGGWYGPAANKQLVSRCLLADLHFFLHFLVSKCRHLFEKLGLSDGDRQMQNKCLPWSWCSP